MKARFFAIAALVLGLASCQKDFAPEANLGAEVDYRIAVSAPELGTTRAGVDGEADTNNAKDSAFGAIDYFQGADWSKVDLRYTLEIYDADENGELKGGVATLVKDRQAIVVDEYKAVTFETRLAPKRNYRFVVFADFVEDGAATAWSEAQKLTNNGLNHRIGATLANIELINEDINDEASDAYFAFKHVVPGNNTHNTDAITLTRPYGKLRVVATDLHELNLNVKPGSVKVVYNAFNANAFNAVTGEIAGEYAEKEFDYDYVVDGIVYTEGYDALYIEKNGEKRYTHKTIFTDYILATDNQHTINFNMFVNDEDGVEIKATAFSTEIPVQRNHLTTIIGNVLTTATEIEVTINDNFANGVEDAPTYVEVWDGKSKNEPKYDAETDTYFVARASELAWIAEQVNTGNNFAGATVKVIAPIELNCEYWTPIGYGDDGANFYSFNGTFDGGDWTIANLCIRDEAADYCNGLFGMTENATIKNVKLNGVIVNTKGGDTAALVGAINGTTVIENIAVEGLVQIDTDMASAGRVGTIVGGGWTSHNVALNNISVNVDEESYVKANTYVGGVAGQILGVTSMTNIYSNIDVYAYNGIVGGIIGSIQHNSTVDGCVADGNVYRETAEDRTENQYKRIGGIAGTWENSVGKVVLDNVKFNGELISPDATGAQMTSFDYATYVGREYTTSKTVGELWINGVKFSYGDRNSVSVNSSNTYDAASQFNKITMYVDEAFNYGTGALEVNGKSVVVDMNNNEVTSGSAANYGFIAKGGADVTINDANIASNGGGIGVNGGSNVVFESGKVHVNTTSTSGRYVFYVDGNSILTINDGEFSFTTSPNNKRAYVYATAGSKVVINGGTFGKASTRTDYKAGIMGTGEVIIYGGTFGFDPSKWVAPGYVAKKVDTNWVVEAVEVSTNINNAISNVEDGGTIVLAAGSYNMPATGGKDITIVGGKDTVINLGATNTGSSDVTLYGVTIKAGQYKGFQHSGVVTYNNVTIQGELFCYGEKDIFNNCTFELNNGYVWTYGSKKVVFEGCTFNTNGKAILVYNEGAGATNVTVKGCTFNASAGAKAGAIKNQNCAAIEIDNFQNSGVGVAHNVTASNNTVGENFSGEWRIKNFLAGDAITVNGTAYTQIAIDGQLMTIDADKNVTVL